MMGPHGIEPPTYRFEEGINLLILKKINKLALQNGNKSRKIRNPAATKIQIEQSIFWPKDSQTLQ